MEGDPIDLACEVLLDRFVPFIDEITQVIKEVGYPPLAVFLASALSNIPPSQRQPAMHEAVLRYREAVEEPAAAIVRKRKALSPSAMEKLAVAFSRGDDCFFYEEALDGIEIELVRIAKGPEVSYLALRVSWSPRSPLRSFPPGGLIINTDRRMLLLYVGPYRPGLSSQGFYLVYDAWANSVSVIPPLPVQSLPMFSRCGIGTGGAILCHSLLDQYLLAELFLQTDRGGTSNKATLFIWRSSGTTAFCWTKTEVVLPLPSECEEHTSRPSFTFCADVVFAVESHGLCWVDLLQGALICDMVAKKPEFRFIPLPLETSVRAGIEGRGQPGAHRSMCCITRDGDQILKFVTVDGYGKCKDHTGVTISCWTASIFVAKWTKLFSFRYDELHANSAFKLPRLMPTYPMLSLADEKIMHITMAADLESMNGRPEDLGRYVLSIDIDRVKILSSFNLPVGSGRIPVNIITSNFTCYARKTSPGSEVQQKPEEKTGSSNFSCSTSAV